MLRLIYLSFLFKWWASGSWRDLCRGVCRRCTGGDLHDMEAQEETEGGRIPRTLKLKRFLVKKSVSPHLVLTSIVADIDVATDWYFWKSSNFEDSKFEDIKQAALAFTVLGTITWILLAIDGLGWLSICAGARKRAPRFCSHRYWSLLNTVIEDLPQLAITFMTTGFRTVAGALNISTAVFAFMGKVADACANHGGDLPFDFMMVETTPDIVEARFVLEDGLATQKEEMEKTSLEIVQANRDPEAKQSMLTTFNVAREHPDWVGVMEVRRIKLNGAVLGTIPEGLGRVKNLTELALVNCALEGVIPSKLGALTALTVIRLGSNQLTGPIPSKLGALTAMTVLSLGSNQLTGPIPSKLGALTALTVLTLGRNQLSGPIPATLGTLSALITLDLGSNQLSDRIPTELSSLAALTKLSLGGNKLTGRIPTELEELTALEELCLDNNKLEGRIPAVLAGLTALTTLNLDHNELTDRIPTELSSLAALTKLSLGGNKLTGE